MEHDWDWEPHSGAFSTVSFHHNPNASASPQLLLAPKKSFLVLDDAWYVVSDSVLAEAFLRVCGVCVCVRRRKEMTLHRFRRYCTENHFKRCFKWSVQLIGNILIVNKNLIYKLTTHCNGKNILPSIRLLKVSHATWKSNRYARKIRLRKQPNILLHVNWDLPSHHLAPIFNHLQTTHFIINIFMAKFRTGNILESAPYPVHGVQPGVLSAAALQHSQCPLRYAEGW